MAFLVKLFLILFISAVSFRGYELYGLLSSRTTGGTAIVFEDDGPERAALNAYINSLDADAERLLRLRGSGKVRVPVRIEVLKEHLPADWVVIRRGNVSVFQISGDYADFWRERGFRYELARFLLLSKVNLRPEVWGDKFPRFVADGLISRAELRSGRDYLLNTSAGYFPGLRSAVLRGEDVSLAGILSDPEAALSAGGAVLSFYEEVSRYMLDLLYNLSGSGGNALEDFIILSCQGNTFDDVFSATVGRRFLDSARENVVGGGAPAGGEGVQRMDLGISLGSLSGGEDLSQDELLSRYMEMRVFNVFNPYPSSEVARRFHKFREVRYEVEEDGEKLLYRADILDLPELYAEHEECHLLPSEKQRELELLVHGAPLLVLDQLRACQDALNDIGRLPVRDSREKLESAVTAVEKRLVEAQAVESELERAEWEYYGPELNYPELYRNAGSGGADLPEMYEEYLSSEEAGLGGL